MNLPEEGEQWLDRALEANPDNSHLLTIKGNYLYRRDNLDKAKALFQRGIALEPENSGAHASLGNVFMKQGAYDKAAVCYERALAVRDDVPNWWNGLIHALYKSGDLDKARTICAKAASLMDRLSIPVRAICREMDNQNSRPDKALGETFYDAIYEMHDGEDKSGGTEVYANLWERVVSLAREMEAKRILDIGCGPGFFASFLHERLPNTEYCGVDFSNYAISKARERCPSFKFLKKRLPLRDFSFFPDFDVVICLEVLEHVDEDREILSGLPGGAHVLASVPNFDSMGHVRVFADEAQVIQRYGDVLEDLAVEAHPLKGHAIIWLMKGRIA
jgi:2-polyprenyl-3-methyl-5-hydroxy-6-metoxy-1,4-benzoquinol methylase